MIFDKYFISDTCELNWEYIDTIPEIQRLKGCKQPEQWHREGDAYNHTKLCIEHAYKMLDNEVYNTLAISQKRLLLLSVLLHDIGKPDTTKLKNGVLHSYGHDRYGEKIARKLLWDENIVARESVCYLIRKHMDMHFLLKREYITELIRMSYNIKLTFLYFVHACDVYGSISNEEEMKRSINNLELFSKVCSTFAISYSEPRISKKNYHDTTLKSLINDKKNPLDIDKGIDVYIMIGISGSGKDTYIGNRNQVSRDNIRYELGYCKEGEKVILSREKENEVTEEFNRRIIEYAKEGVPFYINNMNLKKEYRDSYKKILKDYNVSWHYVYLQAPTFEDNVKRREGQKSRDILESMIDKVEWPDACEWDTFDIVEQKKDADNNIEYEIITLF